MIEKEKQLKEEDLEKVNGGIAVDTECGEPNSVTRLTSSVITEDGRKHTTNAVIKL